jgi:hypothetical protein
MPWLQKDSNKEKKGEKYIYHPFPYSCVSLFFFLTKRHLFSIQSIVLKGKKAYHNLKRK